MNYNEHQAYMAPPASRPYDMYNVKTQLATQLSLTADSLVNLAQVTTDHALRLDELRNDLENMRALLMWISEVHPDVIKQHFALKDIERANK